MKKILHSVLAIAVLGGIMGTSAIMTPTLVSACSGYPAKDGCKPDKDESKTYTYKISLKQMEEISGKTAPTTGSAGLDAAISGFILSFFKQWTGILGGAIVGFSQDIIANDKAHWEKLTKQMIEGKIKGVKVTIVNYPNKYPAAKISYSTY
ncbi:hypothetical protein EEL32_24570 [Brevibacillus laterosporus]|nr:hypothetical protein [Brevibacillus laterosporus]TPG74754.1 hypothetical protein EEL32_24570 [Brevibacillus laterosporus]